MRVAVSGRTAEQVQAVADEIKGLALVGDVTVPADVEGWVERTEQELGPIDLLVANAGIGIREGASLGGSARGVVARVRGERPRRAPLCRAVIPEMLERGDGRIVITGSGASYLPGTTHTAYAASKAAVGRYAETLAGQLRGRIPVFVFSPGLVRTSMTDGTFGDDAPWTPPELAPALVRVLASGRADALAGRYLHAEHDDIEDLIARADEIAANDLNAIRLRR